MEAIKLKTHEMINARDRVTNTLPSKKLSVYDLFLFVGSAWLYEQESLSLSL